MDDTARAVSEAEEVAVGAPLPRLHMIGNAHLDPVWLWRWLEGCAEAIGTCWAAVDMLAQNPDVIFTRGEAALYRWIEELEPALFARIQDLVRQGRWVIVNGWWVQPDCNLPDGEAFVRQALYGKAYVRDRFGVDVAVGYNVDSFGHAGTLPMILRHTGYAHYVFMRPDEWEKALPGPLFDWVAPDGSRVEAFRLLPYYNDWPPLPEKLPVVEALAARVGYPLMCFYGVGNHGGGPTREELAFIEGAQADGHDLVYSDPARYFATVAGVERPVVRDELQMHAIGCYAVVAAIKRLNRRAEGMLAQAEAASALATWHAQAPYPRGRLRSLWEALLFNQFHDILCGTSVASATRDAIEALGGVVQGAEDVLNAALRRLAATIAPGLDPTDATFVVFNLTGEQRRIPVEYEPWVDRKRPDAPARLVDAAGSDVPYQALEPEGLFPGLRLRRMLFAADLPPFGYRVYRLTRGAPAVAPSSTLRTGPVAIESDAWRLEIDRATGGIAHLVDKRAERDIFFDVAHLPIAVEDPSDTWAHGLDRFGLTGVSSTCERIDVVEGGPLRAGLRVQARVGASTVTSAYLLHDDPALPLEIRVRIDWRERQRLLRLRYPVAIAAPTFRYEVPYGSERRTADGREWPGQRWILISGAGGDTPDTVPDEDDYGLAIASDAAYSYAADGASLYITALRSPVYAHHDPHALAPDNEYVYTDQGEHTFTLRLLPGRGLRPHDAHHLADGLTRPPVATPHVSRGGTGGPRASLLPFAGVSGVATWLKGAEDGDGIVLRLLEVDGRRDEALLPETGDRHALAPHSLATLRLGRNGRWRRSDGLES